ncbi:MAG: hypothetical protein ACYSW0_20140, partial [Planctomycetota bacterium]
GGLQQKRNRSGQGYNRLSVMNALIYETNETVGWALAHRTPRKGGASPTLPITCCNKSKIGPVIVTIGSHS